MKSGQEIAKKAYIFASLAIEEEEQKVIKLYELVVAETHLEITEEEIAFSPTSNFDLSVETSYISNTAIGDVPFMLISDKQTLMLNPSLHSPLYIGMNRVGAIFSVVSPTERSAHIFDVVDPIAVSEIFTSNFSAPIAIISSP